MSTLRRPVRERSIVDYEDLAEYDGTPWLSALVNFFTVVGVFIGVYAAIFLAGYWHKGIGATWGLLLILVLDVAVNVGLRVARRRRRRERGIEPPSRSRPASAGRSAR